MNGRMENGAGSYDFVAWAAYAPIYFALVVPPYMDGPLPPVMFQGEVL